MVFLGLLSSWSSTPSMIRDSSHDEKCEKSFELWFWDQYISTTALCLRDKLPCVQVRIQATEHAWRRTAVAKEGAYKGFHCFIEQEGHLAHHKLVSFLRRVSPPWRLAIYRGIACSRAKKHPPTLSQHSSNVISYLKKLSTGVAAYL